MVEIVDAASARFNKLAFQAVESKDPLEGSAPEPKAVLAYRGSALFSKASVSAISGQLVEAS